MQFLEKKILFDILFKKKQYFKKWKCSVKFQMC